MPRLSDMLKVVFPVEVSHNHRSIVCEMVRSSRWCRSIATSRGVIVCPINREK